MRLASAGNTLLRFNGGKYEFRASGGGSFLNGTEKAVERWQRSSSHYAQRPDRDYSPLDPTLTSMAGWSVQMNFDKTSGRHWLWGVNTKIDSEDFEVERLRAVERRRRLDDERQHPLSRNAAGQGVPHLLRAVRHA